MIEDEINHPKHYNQGEIEPIDVIEDWKLGYHLGNTVKYIARCKYKGSEVKDLEKARWYLDRHIKRIKSDKELRSREQAAEQS